jgi:hypothetical protein
MTGARWAVSVLVSGLLAATATTAPVGDDSAVFPFVEGTTWTYAGAVKWTDRHNVPRSSKVRWSSKVVAAFGGGDVAAALLEGGVWDLAWWSPEDRAGSYVLLRVGTRYYLVQDNAKSVFAAAKGSGGRRLPANLEESPWFGTPLKPGQLYRAADVRPRADRMYGWSVDSAAPATLNVAGVTGTKRRAYVLSFHSLPDEETITLVPGIGITSFAYLHHGTTAEADVHLIAFHRGDAK